MNFLISKKVIIGLSLSSFIGAFLLFTIDFFCKSTLIGHGMFYGLIIILVSISDKIRDKTVKGIIDHTILILPLLFIIVMSYGQLTTSQLHGGMEWWFSERKIQYAIMITEGLLMLYLFCSRTIFMKKLNTKSFLKMIKSPIAFLIIFKIIWLIMVDLPASYSLETTAPHLRFEYVTILSIPIFMALFILTNRNIITGFSISIILGQFSIMYYSIVHFSKFSPTIYGPIVSIVVGVILIPLSMRGRILYYFDNYIKMSKFQRFAMKMVLTVRRKLKDHKKILLDAGVEKGMTILDYGCGIGNYTLEASAIVGEEGKITGADISKMMISRLAKDAKSLSMNNIEPVLIKEIDDIEENGFDYIFLIDVLHFINKKYEIIKKLTEKLSDRGKILLNFDHINRQTEERLMTDLAKLPFAVVNLQKKYWVLEKRSPVNKNLIYAIC